MFSLCERNLSILFVFLISIALSGGCSDEEANIICQREIWSHRKNDLLRLYQEKKKISFTSLKLTSFPNGITTIVGLEQLDLYNNQIKELPHEIGHLTNLKTLNLKGNQITVLTTEIGKLESLQTLDLSYNKIKELPSEIGSLESLNSLDLDYNEIMKLPSEIGKLESLQTLHLHNNRITKLPSEIGNLKNLFKLDLNHNQLTALPRSIENLHRLALLDLQNNPNLVEVGEGQTIGWRELRQIFGDRVVLDVDKIDGPLNVISKEELYQELDSKPLHWDRNIIKTLKPILPPEAELSGEELVIMWTRIWDDLRKVYEDLKAKDFKQIIGYMKGLYHMKLEPGEYAGWQMYENQVPYTKNLLEAVLKSIESIGDPSTKAASMIQLMDGLKHCPDGQMAALTSLFNALSNIGFKFSENSEDFMTQIRQVLAFEKHEVFQLAILPGRGSQNVHVLTLWQHKLNEELGLNLPFKPHMGSMNQDPFGNHIGNALEAFYRKFTPNYGISVLKDWVNQNKARVGQCVVLLMNAKKIEHVDDHENMKKYFEMISGLYPEEMLPSKINYDGAKTILRDILKVLKNERGLRESLWKMGPATFSVLSSVLLLMASCVLLIILMKIFFKN